MDIQKKTKIVATIGPATSSVEKLSELLKEGFNVMRMNFSHGDFAEHQGKVDNLKIAVKKTGIPAAMMQDLSGPKIRTGEFKEAPITLKEGQTFVITTEKIIGDETRVSTNYEPLPREVKVGSFILIDDGKKRLQVMSIKGKEITCKVIVGGVTKNRRGINLPGAHLSISSLTDKDKADIAFGLKNKVDFFAFSFVRRAEDIRELRSILNKAKSPAKIIAKVEDTEGLENIDEIIELVDGVMVARGDMAIEIGAENVPMVQKSIIRKCNEQGKFVITATHMLESMIKSPVPTRAEVSDIANAIMDGTDAIMLSEETTLGEFPIEAVKLMTRVALKIEQHPEYIEAIKARHIHKGGKAESSVDAITSEAVDIADRVNAKCIVALTHSGFTSTMVARFRPVQPLVVFTPDEVTARQALITFGAIPMINKKFKTLPEALTEIKKSLLKAKIVAKGDTIVIAGGLPFEKVKPTNTVMVETI